VILIPFSTVIPSYPATPIPLPASALSAV